jgi:putative transposase
MKFGFIAKHRGMWPSRWLCEALGVSQSGFYAWLIQPRSQRSRSDEELVGELLTAIVKRDDLFQQLEPCCWRAVFMGL